MTKRMLIDATHQEETRVVMLDGNRLEDVDFESASKRPIKGNVYLARVTRVEPSLQAAFVEYGGNRHGFLAFSEIHPDYYRIPVDDLTPAERESAEKDDATAEKDSGNGHAENAGVEAAAGEDDDHDEDRVESLGGDEAEEVQERRPRSYRNYKIQEVIKRKQILLVQAVKEERGNKGAALTTYLSLPGRYCVLMPNTARGGGVSRKITNAADRKRIKQIVDDLDVPDGMAVIVRTAGSERSKTEIKRDFDYLMRLWDQIRTDTLSSVAPSLIYEEGTLIKRSLRDVYTSDVEEVLVDGDDGYKTAKDFMKSLIPSHARRIKKYKETDIPLFQRFAVESQLDAMHNPTVQLRSGGYLVINQTEALVAIDVNSGRATRERHIEETAVKTNLEAADEVARQLRLRDLAGLVVIDFIDMEENRHQNQVERRLKEAMRHDRARIQIGRISPFGLLELSRQRLRPSLIESSAQQCSACGGLGWVRSVESLGLQVLRAIEEEGTRKRSEGVVVTVPTRIALYLLNEKRDAVIQIEQRYGLSMTVNADDGIIPPQVYRMERVKASGETEVLDTGDATGDQDEGGRGRRSRRGGRRPEGNGDQRPPRRGRGRRDEREEVEVDAEEEEVEEPQAERVAERPENEESDADGQPKRRRRGRRGGRRRRGRREDERTAADQDDAQTDMRDGTDEPDDDGDAVDGADAQTVDEQQVDAAAEQSPADIVIDAKAPDATPDETPEADAEPVEEKPKRRRPSRSRKKVDADKDGGADDKASDASDKAADAEDKPKRPRRTRKKAPEAGNAEAANTDAAEESAETSGEAATEKPKRTRRTRKKTATDAETETGQNDTQAAAPDATAETATPEPATEVVSEPAPEPATEAVPTLADAPIAGASKPVEVEGTETAESDRPKRKGWWSRLTGQG